VERGRDRRALNGLGPKGSMARSCINQFTDCFGGLDCNAHSWVGSNSIVRDIKFAKVNVGTKTISNLYLYTLFKPVQH
jgi:hypothetical protein